MSDNINGIHYEISPPLKNPTDGYYYQRARQVDGSGNLVGFGEQSFRSARPGTIEGLFGRPLDVARVGAVLKDIGVGIAGGILRKPSTAAAGLAGFLKDLMSGVTGEFKSWPGTDEPWEPPFDWRTGSSAIVVQSGTSGEIGDGNGIENWWDNPGSAPQNRSSRDPWARIPIPDFSTPPLPTAPAWNNVFVRDSAAAAGVPSRNNVFEFGFPESGPAQPSVREASRETPTFQQNAAPDGNFMGNFPRVSAIAATSSPAAFNEPGSSSDPRMVGDFNALGQGVARILSGAGQFIGNGPITPARAALPFGGIFGFASRRYNPRAT